jgi:hypothetical protein
MKYLFGEVERALLQSVANQMLNGGHLTVSDRLKMGQQIERILNGAEVVLVMDEEN